MKILLVNDYATPTAGAELMTLTLRDGLRKRGHEARVFASRAQLIPGDSFADYNCYGTNSRFQVILQMVNLSAYRQLQRALADFQPDVVHVKMFLWQLSPSILPLLRDIPSIYHVVTYKPICPLGSKLLPDGSACKVRAGTACYLNRCLTAQSWLPLILQVKLWRQLRNVFDLIVANSKAVKNQLTAEGIEPVEVIWNGVSSQPLQPSLNLVPTVVFAGRLVREKGADVLLQAFAKVVKLTPEARLILAGEGPEQVHLAKLIANLKLSSKVIMTGQLSRQEMEHRFAGAWIQVIPSRWAEPFGIVTTEAMMRGTAVIASNSGGLSEIVQHGKTGLLVPPDNVEELSKALIYLIQNRELAEQMGRTGHKVALKYFNTETYTEKFVTLYHSLCTN